MIDLQHEHTLRQVKASGVSLQSYDGDKGLYTIAPGNIILKLPGGQEIQSKITDGSLRARDDGVLTSLRLLGPILPDHEAYEVALKVHRAFGIRTNRLEHWKVAIVGKGRDAQGFSNANKAYYPDFFIEMANSMNERYPWFILVVIGWNGLPGDNRDEAWGAVNNPKPPLDLNRVSLDSPSGRTYDRKDAYVHLGKAQEDLDRRLGQVRDANGHLIGPDAQRPPKAKDSRVEAAGTTLDEVQPPSTQWSVIVALIGVIIALLWMLGKWRKG